MSTLPKYTTPGANWYWEKVLQIKEVQQMDVGSK